MWPVAAALDSTVLAYLVIANIIKQLLTIIGVYVLFYWDWEMRIGFSPLENKTVKASECGHLILVWESARRHTYDSTATACHEAVSVFFSHTQMIYKAYLSSKGNSSALSIKIQMMTTILSNYSIFQVLLLDCWPLIRGFLELASII